MVTEAQIGETIRETRIQKGLSQNTLGEKVEIDQSAIGKIERTGRTTISRLLKIAQALAVPVSDLLEPIPLGAQSDARTYDVIPIPVYTAATAASCGAGNGLDYADWEAGEILFERKSAFNEWDDTRKPFGIRIEGDSMTTAGLTDGSIAIINPAEPVMDADTALVSWKGNWFIKWIIYNVDGSIELRSANINYQPIYIEKEYTGNPDLFRIIGKVVDINSKPKRAY